MLLDRIAQPARNAVERPLEPYVTERLDLAAVPADEMMVVVAVGPRRLEARNPVAGIDALDKAQVDESVKSPIDRSDPDRPPRLAQMVVDLLRAQAAVLAPEQLYDRPACAATAVAGKGERIQGVSRPGGLRRGHDRSVSSGV